jgi:hypothetical protein
MAAPDDVQRYLFQHLPGENAELQNRQDLITFPRIWTVMHSIP